MEWDKTTRVVTAVGLIAILLVLPLKLTVGYPAIYYAIVTACAIWAGFWAMGGRPSDERFYARWEKKRQAGKWFVVASESVKSLILLVIIMALGLMLLGGSPEQTLQELSPGMRLGMAALLIAFSIILGTANVQEKNRRFQRLHGQLRQ
ncbi:hypothetical protein B9G55_22045 [Saccharibacillus sp. O16]|nr:hypothetical protein B9G55_22045 [Saccharibacillus sp. O16]